MSKGTRKNKKTGLCEPTSKTEKKSVTPPKPAKKPTPVKVASPIKISPAKVSQKKKRCPKGTRKNKKTGLCEPITKTEQKVKTDMPNNNSVIDVPSVENIEDLGKVVEETVKSLERKKTEILKTVNTPSFTPEANKELKTLNMKTPREVLAYKCYTKETDQNLYENLSIADMIKILKREQHFDSEYLNRISKTLNINNKEEVLKKLIELAKNKPIEDFVKVKMGDTGGKGIDYVCVDWKDKEVKQMMLTNLNSKKDIDFSKIIGPQQYLSNCWFNTSLMCFFISDKGRKFTRGMRQNMIEEILIIFFIIKHQK